MGDEQEPLPMPDDVRERSTLGLSLANKCQLLFGIAVLAILAGALAVPWLRSTSLVEASRREIARALVADRLGAEAGLPDATSEIEIFGLPLPDAADAPPVSPEAAEARRFVREAVAAFTDDPARTELVEESVSDGADVARYARAIRDAEGALRSIAYVERSGSFATGQLLTSRIYIVAAGIFAGLLAILVFYLILTKLILSPVRKLRRTTELVEQGDFAVRSEIHTGDDFEQLSRAFNSMLDQVERTQQRLRSMNENLDLKVAELAETNIGLFESNRLKSEFLANVSHELKTPLNSIIGFAELLDELAAAEADADPKRARYLSNIVTSGRSLLEMINELLQMAKIEAGRVEVSIEPTGLADLVEGLQTIMRPQADARGIAIEARVPDGIPSVETDPGKLQQILYNFLSNALKFSPDESTVRITVDRVNRQGGEPGARIAITDEGPGIPYDMQDTIFEKFRQVDASHTRAHSGTGLGLAICRELAELLGATVALVSEPGHGATFSVELPMVHRREELRPLMDG